MDNRFDQGWKTMQEIDGELGEAVMHSLEKVAPDLGRYIIEFGFGDVYSRPGLDLQQRELVTVAALTAMGGCEAQLEIHINASLNVGLTPNQIIEAIMHCSLYAGFPRVLNAVKVGQRVFDQRGIAPIWEGGAMKG